MSKLRIVFVAILLAHFSFAPAMAQQTETLEDIRQDITQLSEILLELRGELLTTGNSGVSQDSVGTILQRLNMLEAELSAALGRVETLQFRIIQITDDGTQRIGDLEFRLTELEGGDTSNLGTTPSLGGEATPTGGQELATDEQHSFNQATAQYTEGNYQASVEMFDAFINTYPGGPLTSEAQYRKGLALAGLQDWSSAARSYLDSFSGAPDGAYAADSLYELGVSLGALGQAEQACLTLNEIELRYPDRHADLADKILTQKQTLACP